MKASFASSGPDGETRFIREVGNSIPDASGGAGRYVGTIQDITAQKRAEQVLREASDELERRVEERTAELRESEVRLKDAQRIAKLGHSIWDEKEDREVYSSGEAESIFGCTAGLGFQEF